MAVLRAVIVLLCANILLHIGNCAKWTQDMIDAYKAKMNGAGFGSFEFISYDKLTELKADAYAAEVSKKFHENYNLDPVLKIGAKYMLVDIGSATTHVIASTAKGKAKAVTGIEGAENLGVSSYSGDVKGLQEFLKSVVKANKQTFPAAQSIKPKDAQYPPIIIVNAAGHGARVINQIKGVQDEMTLVKIGKGGVEFDVNDEKFGDKSGGRNTEAAAKFIKDMSDILVHMDEIAYIKPRPNKKTDSTRKMKIDTSAAVQLAKMTTFAHMCDITGSSIKYFAKGGSKPLGDGIDESGKSTKKDGKYAHGIDAKFDSVKDGDVTGAQAMADEVIGWINADIKAINQGIEIGKMAVVQTGKIGVAATKVGGKKKGPSKKKKKAVEDEAPEEPKAAKSDIKLLKPKQKEQQGSGDTDKKKTGGSKDEERERSSKQEDSKKGKDTGTDTKNKGLKKEEARFGYNNVAFYNDYGYEQGTSIKIQNVCIRTEIWKYTQILRQICMPKR